jgi:hypothetical protein
MKAKTYKIGDLVQWRYPRSNAILRRKGYIVAIREDLEDPEGKGDLVYDIQWFGHDQLDRMIETWFKPLTAEAQNEV